MKNCVDNYFNKKILFLFLAFNPCIDFIFSLTNIALGIKTDIGFNQLIRIGLILYISIFIKNRKYLVISLVVGLCLVGGLMMYKLTGITNSWVADIAFSAKIWCGVTLLFAYIDLYKQGKLEIKMIGNTLAIALIVMSISIILSAIGIGFDTYGNDRYGSKGFFNSQNAVGITLLLLISINWIFYIKTKINLVAFVLGAIAVVLVGTKTALIGIIVCTILFFIYELVNNKKIVHFIKFNKIKFVVLVGVFVVLILFLGVAFFSGYFKAVPSYDSLYSVLVSNRNLQVDWMREYVENGNGDFMNVLFGFGYSSVRTYLQSRKVDFSTVEQDYFGLFYISGVIVLILYVCITIRMIYLIYKSVKEHCFTRVMMGCSVAFGLGIFHAFFAGHVFSEALTLTYFWLICAIIRVEAYKKVKI